MTSVSVGIVTYNSAADIASVLDCLFTRVTGVALTVYVIDNHSTDDTVRLVRERWPQAVVLPQSDNRGFGHGHNACLPLLSSEYHLILNPDITFDTDVLSPLCAFLDAHPQATICTPTILSTDGHVQPVPRRLPKRRYMLAGKLERLGGVFRRWRTEYTRRDEVFTQPTEIETCTGCFMLIRTALLRELGGFDERFFMYCEDSDLSRRAAKHGGIWLVPSVCVTHAWEKASGHSLKFLKIHLQSMHRYFKKWKKEDAG